MSEGKTKFGGRGRDGMDEEKPLRSLKLSCPCPCSFCLFLVPVFVFLIINVYNGVERLDEGSSGIGLNACPFIFLSFFSSYPHHTCLFYLLEHNTTPLPCHGWAGCSLPSDTKLKTAWMVGEHAWQVVVVGRIPKHALLLSSSSW